MTVFVGGCETHSSVSNDPVTALSDQELTKNDRRRAIEIIVTQMDDGTISVDEGREALKKYAWRRSEPNVIRIDAITALLESDPADTSRMLALMLPTETDWEVIEIISDLAAEGSWTEMAPALVRSWSRPVVEPTDANRPERAALDALFPDETVEATVYRVFSTPQEDRFFGDRARMDAWALLQRIDTDGSQSRALLVSDTSSADGDALLEDLLAGANDLMIVPRTSEQLDWLRTMRKAENAEFWTAAAAAINTLNDQQLEGFAIRHVVGVYWATVNEPSWIHASREELLSRLDAELESRKHHQRTDGYVDFNGDQRETLSAWRDRLSWGDAVLLLIAARAVEDPNMAIDFFEQTARDQGDTTTEYGGVIDSVGNGFVAILYPPRPTQRINDTRFVASPEMLEAGAISLFHYHFHVQKSRNSQYAGPGHGDLEYADRFGRSCIVLTTISNNTLNADYYQPGGARIDLGEISRPR